MQEPSSWQRALGVFSRLASAQNSENAEAQFPVMGPVLLLVIVVLLGVSAFLAVKTLHGANIASPAAISPSTLLGLTNGDRSANGLPTLSENAQLDQAAIAKANDMAQKSYFAHITPDGKTPLDFLTAVGYRYQNVGENLGLNYDDAASAEAGWMNSPEHRANILLPLFTQIGIGVASGMYEGAPATFVVEEFATPLPTATTVAVAKPVAAPIAVSAPAAVVTTQATKPATTVAVHAASASGGSTKPTASTTTQKATTTMSAANAEKIRELQQVIAALQAEIQALTIQLNQIQS